MDTGFQGGSRLRVSTQNLRVAVSVTLLCYIPNSTFTGLIPLPPLTSPDFGSAGEEYCHIPSTQPQDVEGTYCLLLFALHPSETLHFFSSTFELSLASCVSLALHILLSPSSFPCRTDGHSSLHIGHLNSRCFFSYPLKQNIKNKSNKKIIAAAENCSDFSLLPLAKFLLSSSWRAMSVTRSRQCASEPLVMPFLLP